MCHVVSLVKVQPEGEEPQDLHLAALLLQHAHQLRQLRLANHVDRYCSHQNRRTLHCIEQQQQQQHRHQCHH